METVFFVLTGTSKVESHPWVLQTYICQPAKTVLEVRALAFIDKAGSGERFSKRIII